MTPYYFALDCVPTPEGRVQVIDVQGRVGAGLSMLAAAYGGKSGARARLQPYLQRLGEVAQGRLILFLHDSFAARQPFPDDFFNLVQKYSEYGPITDWVPDLQAHQRAEWDAERTPDIEEMRVFLDPLASRLRLKIAYCSNVRVDFQNGEPKVLLSGYRERSRRRETSVILSPEEIGVAVFNGISERFPDDLRVQAWFPFVNPPLLDRLLDNKWMLPHLLEGTEAAKLLPRWIPVGMGLRTSAEVMEFTESLHASNGSPVAVLKPSHMRLRPGVRYLDRTAVRALAARQPRRRLPARLGKELLSPTVAHSYEEISRYKGKLLDNLLRTPGARVHDHRDGTFHFSAPYPFLECTASQLQEFVEGRPVRSRRTGKFHRGTLRVVVFSGAIVAAVHRLEQEPDDGIFRDPARPQAARFYESASPEEEAELQAALGPFVSELEQRFGALVVDEVDVDDLRREWVIRQTGGA